MRGSEGRRWLAPPSNNGTQTTARRLYVQWSRAAHLLSVLIRFEHSRHAIFWPQSVFATWCADEFPRLPALYIPLSRRLLQHLTHRATHRPSFGPSSHPILRRQAPPGAAVHHVAILNQDAGHSDVGELHPPPYPRDVRLQSSLPLAVGPGLSTQSVDADLGVIAVAQRPHRLCLELMVLGWAATAPNYFEALRRGGRLPMHLKMWWGLSSVRGA